MNAVCLRAPSSDQRGVKAPAADRPCPGLRLGRELPGRDSRGPDRGRRRDRDSLRDLGKAKDRACVRTLAPTSAIIGAGLGDSVGLITGRQVLGRDLWHGGGARCAGGRSGRSHCPEAGKATASPSTPSEGCSSSKFQKRSSPEGAPPGRPPTPRYTAGVLYKYSLSWFSRREREPSPTYNARDHASSCRPGTDAAAVHLTPLRYSPGPPPRPNLAGIGLVQMGSSPKSDVEGACPAASAPAIPSSTSWAASGSARP